MTEEKQPYAHFDIQPVRGVKIDGFTFIDYRPVALRQWRSLALEATYINPSTSLGTEVTKLLQSPRQLTKAFQPLSFHQQDTDEDGTRTLKGVVPGHPGRIVVLSGCGVVRTQGNTENGKFVLEPPHWREKVDKYIQMGHTQIDDEGATWSQPNETVFGAYALPDLTKKIENTEKYSGLINHAHNFHIEAAGKHRFHPTYGWMVYSIPSNAIRTTEFLAIDLMKRKSSSEPGEYGQFIAVLFQRIKMMHDQGVVHLELHPGNCYPVLEENGKVDVIVTDWTTAQNLSQLPSASELQQQGYQEQQVSWPEFTPQQRAKANDLYIALENATLLSGNTILHLDEYKKEFEIPFKAMGASITREMVDLEMVHLAVASLKYMGVETTPSTLDQVRIALWEVLEKVIAPGIASQDNLLLNDFRSARKNIFDMERPNYLLPYAILELKSRLVKSVIPYQDGEEFPLTIDRLTALPFALAQEHGNSG